MKNLTTREIISSIYQSSKTRDSRTKERCKKSRIRTKDPI